MVSALDSGASGLASSPGWEHCVVFLGKTVCPRGVLPIMAYLGKLRPKGVPFSGFMYMKG